MNIIRYQLVAIPVIDSWSSRYSKLINWQSVINPVLNNNHSTPLSACYAQTCLWGVLASVSTLSPVRESSPVKGEKAMADNTTPVSDVLRRTVLKAGGATAGILAIGGAATAQDDASETDNEDGDTEGPAVDEPDGFEVGILQGHTPFPDELAATFSLEFTGTGDTNDGPPIGAHAHLDDQSTMVVAEVNWEPGGTSGWHRHPGVVLVSVLEGEIEVTWEQDCVPRTYSAGEGFFDPGVIHTAENMNSEEGARAYAVFLGIPDGEPATIWVEPVEC